MLDMNRTIIALTCLLTSLFLSASDEKRPSYPSVDYDVARAHEIKPHRRTIPLEGRDVKVLINFTSHSLYLPQATWWMPTLEATTES